MKNYVLDAVKYNGKPVRMYSVMETEVDYAVRKTTVSKVKGGYKVVKNVYRGYWGGNDGKSYNYQIIYKVKKSSKSKYGYVITKMNVKAK